MKLDQNQDPVIGRIMQEIAICREDERNSQNMQLQIISIAGVVLGALLATSFLFGNDNANQNLWALSLLSDLIFLTAYSYMAYLGIGNILRYHYLQDLEVQLSKYAKLQLPFSDWMGTTSPVTTRNIKHLKHGYSIIHYFSYTGSALFAIAFCFLITGILYSKVKIHREWATIGFVVVVAFGVVDILILIIGSTNAFKMYKWATKEAQKRAKEKAVKYLNLHMKKKLGSTKQERKAEIHRGIIYYIYPKAQDAQKMFLIVLGAICALTYRASGWQSLINDAYVHLKDFGIAFVVIELLLYAARYQVNDIRGVSEDDTANNMRRACGKCNRGMPIMFRDRKKNVLFSLFIVGLKIGLAIAILLYHGYKEKELDLTNAASSFTGCMVIISLLVLVATILYEIAKSSEQLWFVIVAVGVGYPLRFLAGYLAIQQDAHMILKLPVCFLSLAFYFYGIMAATLPWTYYAAQEMTNEKFDNYSKLYYKSLEKYILYHPLVKDNADSIELPVQRVAPWALSAVCSLFFVCCAWASVDVSFFSPLLLFIAVLMIGKVDPSPSRKQLTAIIVLTLCCLGYYISKDNLFLSYIAFLTTFIFGTYAFLCFEFDKKDQLLMTIVGKGTYNWIQKGEV